MSDLSKLSISEAAKKLQAGEITSVDLVRSIKKNIDARNASLNAYLEVFEDIEEQARAADERRKKGENHTLLGIPLAIKDNILIEARRASAASKILENYTATYDATAIQKLKEAGAVFIGRTNMDEFAMGGSNENSAFGPVKNPADESRISGGSSGGSSAAVAAYMALGALGRASAAS
jgi:aspartyl-tRNA(Asn)/glutamyl-tRNA(Gln) amidotransferase subunit A